MTGVPNEVGRYLVNVYCAEWRGGVVIDTVKREFQFVVAVCSGSSYLSHNTKDTIIVAGDSINFQVSGGDAYFWSPGTYLSNATVSDPVGHFPVPGDFQYTVFSINDSGCNDLETINVQVWESSGFIVPNAFTPNGDSKNDILRPLPVLGGQLISFKIFDRKGIMVYNGGPIGGWDGTYNGVRQDMGVYYWYLQFIDANGLERRERGDVMLVR